MYVDRSHRGDGVGARLIAALEERLPPGCSYVLLVLGANEHARRFYARHGFAEELTVDGPAFFAAHMGIALPPGDPVPAFVMRRTLAG